jgi:hypothetical protein
VSTEREWAWYVTALYKGRRYGTFTVTCEHKAVALQLVQHKLGFCWGNLDDPLTEWTFEAIRVAVMRVAKA